MDNYNYATIRPYEQDAIRRQNDIVNAIKSLETVLTQQCQLICKIINNHQPVRARGNSVFELERSISDIQEVPRKQLVKECMVSSLFTRKIYYRFLLFE